MVTIAGIVNRNPVNIKQPYGDQWEGSVGVDKKGHAVFVDEVYAIRAFCKTICNYQLKYKRFTLRSIIDHYAPSEDGNEPAKYAAFLADRFGIHDPASVKLRFFNERGFCNKPLMITLIEAVIEYEIMRGWKLCEEKLISGIAYYEHDWPKADRL